MVAESVSVKVMVAESVSVEVMVTRTPLVEVEKTVTTLEAVSVAVVVLVLVAKVVVVDVDMLVVDSVLVMTAVVVVVDTLVLDSVLVVVVNSVDVVAQLGALLKSSRFAGLTGEPLERPRNETASRTFKINAIKRDIVTSAGCKVSDRQPKYQTFLGGEGKPWRERSI